MSDQNKWFYNLQCELTLKERQLDEKPKFMSKTDKTYQTKYQGLKINTVAHWTNTYTLN